MQVKYAAIKPSTWRCGDVAIDDSSNNQYEITDAEKGKAFLRKLEPNERNKPEHVTFIVSV